jgi:hypothetical protein
MIRTSARVTNPDDVEVTMTVTMTAGEWTRLACELSGDWPAWSFRQAVKEALEKFSEAHYSVGEYGDR